MSKRSRMIKFFATVLMLSLLCTPLLPCLVLTSYAEDAVQVNSQNGVSSVTLNSAGDRISVNITLSEDYVKNNSKVTLSLFELPLGADAGAIRSLTPVASFRATKKYVYKTDLTSGSMSKLYSSYLLAAPDSVGGYTPVGTPHFIENPGAAASYTYAYPAVSSPKGLEVESVSDALSLGVSHAVINLPVAEFYAPGQGADTLSYDLGGVTYHFSSAALARLDEKVKALSNESVRVYLRIELGTAGYSSYELLTALLELLARRYTDPAGDHGFCGSFIIGREANLPAAEELSFISSPDENLVRYSTFLRIAYNALCSVYREGRVFASVSNNYSIVPENAGSAGMTAGAFLSALSAKTAEGGDFDWSVATSAYAFDRADSSIWDDALASGASSQYISPANINVLTYALSKSCTYGGTPRRLIIDSFAVSSQGSDASATASYIYAYYKVIENGGVDALIYSEQFDEPGETSGCGLSVTDLSGNQLSRKSVWTAFRAVDTTDIETIRSLGEVAGSAFEYLFDSLYRIAGVKCAVTGNARIMTSADRIKESTLFDFTVGERCGFVGSGYGYSMIPSLTLAGGMPALSVDSGAEYRLVRRSIERRKLSGSDYIIVDIASCPTSGRLTLRLSQTDRLVYESTVSFAAGTERVLFDISDFTDEMSKESVNMTLGFAGGGRYSISEIIVGNGSSASSILVTLLVALGILVALMAVIALFTNLVHVIRRRKSRTTAIAPRDEDE